MHKQRRQAPERDTYLHYIATISRKLPYPIHMNGLEPSYVAEVLTMREVYIFREHTIANLEAACIVDAVRSLEGVVVTLATYHLEGLDTVDVLLAVLVGNECHQLHANSIVQAGFVNNNFDVVFDVFFELYFF